MARSVGEWKGKTDDSTIPPRVKLRVAKLADYKCALCGRGAKPGDTDHREPVIFSTPQRPLNIESNLQWLCVPCHKSKTRKDVAEKALAAKRQKRAAGVEGKSAWAKKIAWHKERGWKPKWS
jgi:5-methylcytosine-specific restriction protein A